MSLSKGEIHRFNTITLQDIYDSIYDALYHGVQVPSDLLVLDWVEDELRFRGVLQ